MLSTQLSKFKRKLPRFRKPFRRFLSFIDKHEPTGIDRFTVELEKEVWKDIDCLTCANCCKKMTPTFTKTDIQRISAHFNQTPAAFTKQWLERDDINDLVNVNRPCQFLNLSDNKCSIYAIRPADCAGFPHLSKKKWTDYAHVHKQNIDYCPATFSMVEKMQNTIEFK